MGELLKVSPIQIGPNRPSGFRFEARRRPGRILPLTPRSPQFRTPSFRTSESRPSTFRSFNHLAPSQQFENPRAVRHTSFVHQDAVRGMEPLGRLVTADVRPVRVQISHSTRAGESRLNPHPNPLPEGEGNQGSLYLKKDAGKVENGSSVISLRSSEKQQVSPLQEVQVGQHGAEVSTVQKPENNSEITTIEHKKYSNQLERIVKVLYKVEPVIMATRIASLVSEVAENYVFVDRLQGAKTAATLLTPLAQSVVANPHAFTRMAEHLPALSTLALEASLALEAVVLGAKVLEKAQVKTKMEEQPDLSVDPGLENLTSSEQKDSLLKFVMVKGRKIWATLKPA